MAIHLMNNEEVLWRSHEGKHYRRYILIRDSVLAFICIVAVILVLGVLTTFANTKFLLIIIGVILAIFLLVIVVNQYLLLMNLYVITNERVIIKRGWLNRKITSIRLENIIDTKAEQSFTGRLIKSGTIYLFTANDSQNSDENFIQHVPKISNVDHPFQRHSKIVELLKGNK